MRRFIAIITGLVLASCSGPTANDAYPGPDTTDTDTTNYALNTDSVNLTLRNATPPEGFYQVMLPCTNCKGIEHTVLFRPDLSYQMEETVVGSGKPPAKTTGAWKLVESDIWLYKDSNVVARYTWKRDTLNYIDLKSGVRIPLRALPNAEENEAWKEKKKEGAAFFGIGNEPFWNITVNEKNLVFNMAGWAKPLSLKTAKPIPAPDSTVYQAHNDTASLRLVIYNQFCSDGMSDNQYANSVKVVYNGHEYEGCGIRYK
jgi:uncharacterized membrane protein